MSYERRLEQYWNEVASAMRARGAMQVDAALAHAKRSVSKHLDAGEKYGVGVEAFGRAYFTPEHLAADFLRANQHYTRPAYNGPTMKPFDPGSPEFVAQGLKDLAKQTAERAQIQREAKEAAAKGPRLGPGGYPIVEPETGPSERNVIDPSKGW